MPSITVKDVAAHAGVSKSSASAILSGVRRDLFRADTIEAVLNSARELGYQAHAGARLMRQGRRCLIGIAARTEILDWHTVTSLIVATHAELTGRDLQPVIVDPEQMVPGKSFAPFPSPEMLAGIVSIDMAMERCVPSFYKVLGARLPIVALYPVKDGGIDCVTTDRTRGIGAAFAHLWQLGHRRIAFAESQPSTSLTSRVKIDAWRKMCRKHTLLPAQSVFIALDDRQTPMERGEYAARQLLAMSAAARPTALMCGGDEVALSALRVLSEAGWTVPKDISIIGFDDVRHAQYSVPPLTTVAQPVAAVARAAVDRLIDLIEISRKEEDWQPQTRLVAPKVVVRESTGPVSPQ